MSEYLPDYLDERVRWRRVEAALEGVPFLTLDDLLRIMGADPDCCDARDRAAAAWDLRALGYREEYISKWGLRGVFKRWVKIARDDEWYRQNLPGRRWQYPRPKSPDEFIPRT